MDTNYYGTEQAVATTMKVVQNATGRMVATGCNRQEAYTAEVARMVEAGCKESASMAVAMAAVKVEAVMTAGTVTDMAAVVQAAYAEVFAFQLARMAKPGDLLITETYSPDAAGHSPEIGKPARQAALVDKALGRLADHLASRILAQI